MTQEDRAFLHANAQFENRLDIRAIGIDDEINGLNEEFVVAEKLGFSAQPTRTLKELKAHLNMNGPNNVLIADNYLPGVKTLGGLGHKELATSNGTLAGFRILTNFCLAAGLVFGLKILVTGQGIDDELLRQVRFWEKEKGEQIHLFNKNLEEDRSNFTILLSNFKDDRLAQFRKDKFVFVEEITKDWELTERERAALFGTSSLNDPTLDLQRKGLVSRYEFERRCDLIYRLKCNIVLLIGPDNLLAENQFLRSPNYVLAGQTPIEYIVSASDSDLFELSLRLEGRS